MRIDFDYKIEEALIKLLKQLAAFLEHEDMRRG